MMLVFFSHLHYWSWNQNNFCQGTSLWVILLTYSESLMFPRQPLPETEYNGNPESVGYRVRVLRADLRGEASIRLVSDRLEREITLEGLEEWTEYQLQIQAFNSIGPGPWSETVKGRTRESGEDTQFGHKCDGYRDIFATVMQRASWNFLSQDNHILKRKQVFGKWNFISFMWSHNGPSQHPQSVWLESCSECMPTLQTRSKVIGVATYLYRCFLQDARKRDLWP